jgi:hypothetical protein
MTIDKKDRLLDVAWVIAFGVLIAVTGLAGSFGVKPIIDISSSRIIHHPVLKPPLKIQLSGLTPSNFFVYADLQFVSRSYKDVFHDSIFFNFSIRFISDATIVTQKMRRNIEFRPSYPDELARATNPMRLFFDRVFDYDEVEFNVFYDPGQIWDNVDYIVSTQYRTNPLYAISELICRLVSTLLLCVVLAAFLVMIQTPLRNWKIEQILTTLWVFLSILHLNPVFYGLNTVFGSYFFTVSLVIFKGAFSAYSRVYFIAIFDCLSFDRLVGQYFGLYCLYLGVHFILQLFHELNEAIVMIDYSTNQISNYGPFFAVEKWVDIFYYAWAIFAMARATLSSQLKRGWRLPIYLLLVSDYCVWTYAAAKVCEAHVFLAESSMKGIMNLTWSAGIPVMCLFFFWPSPIVKPEAKLMPVAPAELNSRSMRKFGYSWPNLRAADV